MPRDLTASASQLTQQEKMNSYFLGSPWFPAERYADMTKVGCRVGQVPRRATRDLPGGPDPPHTPPTLHTPPHITHHLTHQTLFLSLFWCALYPQGLFITALAYFIGYNLDK